MPRPSKGLTGRTTEKRPKKWARVNGGSGLIDVSSSPDLVLVHVAQFPTIVQPPSKTWSLTSLSRVYVCVFIY